MNKSDNSNTQGYELVNFCEFDKYAAKSYCAIHGVDESLNLGDITKVDEHNLEPFNMICGGSPCQDFSVAGKGAGSMWKCLDCGEEYNPLTVHYSKRHRCPKCESENLDKTRSSLLVEWLRVIRANKPRWGIYENVKNIVGKKFKDTFQMFIEELNEYGYNTYYKVLNAKDYGIPQNRERVYLIIILKEFDNGLFKFPEPFDNGLCLKDMLEDEVDEKYYINTPKARELIENLIASGKLEKAVSNAIRAGGRGSIDRHQWDVVQVPSILY
ncbi:MAG: DNA (cytosine-5-)-methyltransferase [Alphaproteobacteria bacterium]|nr:DNA (cytosine-5-)-methyltransferase [Alphaproteobacteria bacterium]